MGRAREDLPRSIRKRAKEIRERAPVLEVVLALGLAVARDGALNLQAGLDERDPVTERKRQTERIRLDPAGSQMLVADREPHHPARHRHRLQFTLAGHSVDEGTWRG